MANKDTVPFNLPCWTGNELRYAAQVLEAGHISGNGPYTKKCEKLLEEMLGAPRVLLTTSCTHALEMAALLLNIGPGDEVIVPSFTFVTTANAFALRGANLVFADIRLDTLNMDERRLENLITSRTKALVPVHYAGVGCEMDVILDIARRHNVAVIEDNAHGLFGKYKGKYLGTFGTFATQSFHETKNFTCGEGGALVVNDASYIERAEIIRQKGTNRARFFRGEVDKYSWVDLGSSYLPSDMLAGFLYAQLEQRKMIQARREAIWRYYYAHLGGWAEGLGVGLPIVPAHCEQAWHIFYLLMDSLKQRQALIKHLEEQGIMAVFHYVPLHLSKMASSFWGTCPMAEEAGDRLVRLPFYTGLDRKTQRRVVGAILEFDQKG